MSDDNFDVDFIFDHDDYTNTTTIIAKDTNSDKCATFCVSGKTILASGGRDTVFKSYIIDVLELDNTPLTPGE